MVFNEGYNLAGGHFGSVDGGGLGLTLGFLQLIEPETDNLHPVIFI